MMQPSSSEAMVEYPKSGPTHPKVMAKGMAKVRMRRLASLAVK